MSFEDKVDLITTDLNKIMFSVLWIVLISFLLTYYHIATKRPYLYPPGPKWYPIIGNTLMLRKEVKKYGSQAGVFRAWKYKYNSPVIGLKLGKELFVVALTYPIINEIHTNSVFDGRPDNFFQRLRNMGQRLGITSTDGDLWSEQRNFVMCHLRRSGYGRQAMEKKIQAELNDLTNLLLEYSTTPVWPGGLAQLSVLNVLWNLTTGTKMSRNDPQLKHLLSLMRQRNHAFDLTGGLLNAMPFLRFIAPEKTSYNLINRLNIKLHNFFKPIIEEHKKKFTTDKIDDDLIYAFLNEMKQAKGDSTNFTDAQLITIILDLFIAGSHSSSATLDFILMAMVLHPDVQRRCQAEIDNVLKRDEVPKFSDKTKLSYVEAVILETQRFYNVAQVSGPRRVMEDVMLGGYLVPKNTTVLIGLETVSMDTEYWGDPHAFRPERFLDSTKKITNTERFVAFGQGRRKCLGEQLARSFLFIFTAGILQKFNLEIPPNGKPPSNEVMHGLLAAPKPYEIIFKTR